MSTEAEDLEKLRAQFEWHKTLDWERRRLTDMGCGLDFVHNHMLEWERANPKPE